MNEILNDPLYQKYPRLYATASTYGFNRDDIDTMMNIFDDSKLKEYMSYPEIDLKALMVRLDVHKEYFKDKISEVFFMNLEKQREFVGIRQLPYLAELYYRW